MKILPLLALLSVLFGTTAASAQSTGSTGGGGASLNDLLGAADELAATAELVSIATNVIENTLDTYDRMIELDKELKDLEKILNEPSFIKYSSVRGRNAILDKVRYKSRQIQFYSLLIKDLLKLLKRLSTEMANSEGGGALEAIQEGIGKAAGLIGGVAGAFTGNFSGITNFLGGGSPEEKTVEELKTLNKTERMASYREALSNFIMKLDEFNQRMDAIYTDIRTLKYRALNYTNMIMLANYNDRPMRYADRRRLNK